MVDNKANVYIVSKVNAGQYPKLVRLPHRAWGTKHRVKVDEGVYLSLKATRLDPVGGDISRDGHEVSFWFRKTDHWEAYRKGTRDCEFCECSTEKQISRTL
ncbi:hypothetical protein DPMN_098133 [Dreissena polymorpha]|uniref:Uncharacterized protein n=1 Tax=Dreissena polymorpha TaxID=45954 RepID=A0A9D4LCG5_DREPO|nr:hypothetical protein DPMN_098133 [Dreissena polymorpha]